MQTLQILKDDFPASLLALEHATLVFGGLLIYFLLTKLGQQRRPPSSAVAWVMLIGIFPYIGIPLFLLFGARKFARPMRNLHVLKPADSGQEDSLWATRLLATMNVPSPSHNLSVIFHENGLDAKYALLELINCAERQVELCSFILASDEMGLELSAALARCASRGVKVRILLDAIGSPCWSRRHVKCLQDKGVEVRWFMPLLHNPTKGRSNLRNHRKMLIADSTRFWSGGRNFASEYFIDRFGHRAWVDLSFVVEGPLAKQAQVLFERDWSIVNGIDRTMNGMPKIMNEVTGARAQLIPSGPDLADDTLYDLLLTAAYQAQRRIIAVTPYFVPDDALLSAWCLACRRGVEFTLLIPSRSNHRLADLAREPALRELAKVGGKIFLFPAMMHAKAVIIDDRLALCGSANLDGRSLFLNFELMTAFYGTTEITWLADWARRSVDQSKPYIAHAPGLGRSLIEGLVRTVGFQL